MTKPSFLKKHRFWIIFLLATSLVGAAVAYAFPPLLAMLNPETYPLAFQEAASPVAENLHHFHAMLMIIITTITIFVMLLLLVVILKFNAKANPQPAQFSHNTLVEVVWTIIPVIILIIIIIPSMKLLFFMDRTTEAEMTLKVTGYQWYWGYEYPDQDGINFTSYMIPENEIDTTKGEKRLLSVDNPVVLPVDTNIQVIITAGEVLHSFAMPALGLKTDAVPGRLNETWVRITKPGTYYGQCSELCGKGHAYMPIEIRAVSKELFAQWAAAAKDDVEKAYDLLPATLELSQAPATTTAE